MSGHDIQKILGIGKITAAAFAEHGITTVGQLAELEDGEISINNLSTLIGRARLYKKNAEATEEAHTELPKLVVIGSTSTARPVIVPPLFGSAFKTKLKPGKKKGKPPGKVHSTASPVESAPTSAHDESEEEHETRADTPLPVKEEEEEEAHDSEVHDGEEKYMISDHSWWEMKVLIPRTQNIDEKGESTYALKEAIVYELSIEPHNRISFVCSWLKTTEASEQREKLCTMTYSPQILFYFNLGLPPLEISIRPEDFEALPNQHALTNVIWETNLMKHFQVRPL